MAENGENQFLRQTSALLKTKSFHVNQKKCKSGDLCKLDWLTFNSLQPRRVGTLVSLTTENLPTESFVPSNWRGSMSCHGVLYATAHCKVCHPTDHCKTSRLKLCLFQLVVVGCCWVWSSDPTCHVISLLWCCGQPLTALKKILRGVNEETCRTEAAQAVQSIPAYVEASDLFIALVPEVKHQDLGLISSIDLHGLLQTLT